MAGGGTDGMTRCRVTPASAALQGPGVSEGVEAGEERPPGRLARPPEGGEAPRPRSVGTGERRLDPPRLPRARERFGLPYGTLRLDPTSLLVIGSGALDAQGRAAVSLLVPSNPSLVGVSADWQVAVGPPLRLTNLEVTTLSDL